MAIKKSAKTRTQKPSTAEIRAWAVVNYDGIGTRGRIPAHVLADFEKTTQAKVKS